MDKKARKRADKKCHFCGEADYNLLDTHRILEGAKGGKYKKHNIVTCCSLCHRKIHSGRIKILGRHFTTSGQYILHYTEDDEEKWG